MIERGDAGYELARRVYNAMIDRRPALVAQAAGRGRRRPPAGVRAAARPPRRDPRRRAQRRRARHRRRRPRDRPLRDPRDRRRPARPHRPRRRRLHAGARSTAPRTSTGSPPPAGSSRPPASAGSRSAAASATSPASTASRSTTSSARTSCSPSGELVHASKDEHPDLFWALRGGGGNFGVVTAFEFRLHEVDTVIAGPTFWPIECGATVLAAYREFLPAAPRELNGFFAFATVPPAPPFPEPLHMRKVCGVVWCHTGGEAAAARDMQPLLDALPEPLMHGVQPMPHPVLQSAFDDALPARATSGTGAPTSSATCRTRRSTCTREHGAALPTWKSTMHLYPIDGAPHDVGPEETAFAYRDANYGAVIAGVDPDPANARGDRRLVARLPGGAAPLLRGRRLREHDDGRGPRPRARELPRQLRAARADQGRVRPGEPAPGQPEHPAGALSAGRIEHAAAPRPPAVARCRRDPGPPGSRRPARRAAPPRSRAAATRRRP